ncbi:unnamed protein product, partial [Pleuronectes platessa]
MSWGFSQKPLLSSKPRPLRSISDTQLLKASIIAMTTSSRRRTSQRRYRCSPLQKREIHSAEEHELHIPEEEGRRSSHRAARGRSAVWSGPAAEDRLRDHVIHWPTRTHTAEGGT